MPSQAKAIKAEEDNGSWRVVVKARGVNTEDETSLVARRAKFAAARHVGVLRDYIPDNLTDFDGANINEMMEGRYFAEIVDVREVDETDLPDKVLERIRVQRTVLYGIKVDK